MSKNIFKDAQDDVDLRFIGANIHFIRSEEKRVKGLREGQVITYHNRAGTRFRHLRNIPELGGTCLIIPPFDPNDKYTLSLKESEVLAKTASLRKHRELFETMADGIRQKKARSDAWKKSRAKAKRKKKKK